MKINELADAYQSLIASLTEASAGITYFAHFLTPNPDAIEAGHELDAMKAFRHTYLLGILERCHLACMTSLARSDRWLQSACTGAASHNVLGFAASLRGLLESTADAHDVMSVLPDALHKLFPYLYLVFEESDEVARVQIGLEDLENRLIHYAFAGRPPRGVQPLPQHKNKSNADYIRAFEAFGVAGAADLYAELCELTHPASPSVFCFVDEGTHAMQLNFSRDEALIADILTRYEATIENLTTLSLNPALIGLCFLHRLVDEWPAPTDRTMADIGNVAMRIKQLDAFVEKFKAGHLDREALARAIAKR